MSPPSPKQSKPTAEPSTLDAATTFEAAQEELEGLIARIESGAEGGAGLEESMAAYERGLALLKHCRGILEQAEQKFTDLTGKFKEEA